MSVPPQLASLNMKPARKRGPTFPKASLLLMTAARRVSSETVAPKVAVPVAPCGGSVEQRRP